MTTPSAVPIEVAVSVERNEQSTHFFDAASEGRLLIRRCEQCGQACLARRTVCRSCGSTRLAWETSAGTGVLRSWAVNPACTDEATATTFGLVELAEGPWSESLLIVSPECELADGLAMRVVFVQGPGGEIYPAFAPAD